MKRLNYVLCMLAVLAVLAMTGCTLDGIELGEPEYEVAEIVMELEPIPPSDGSEELAPQDELKLQPVGCLPNDWAYSSAPPIDTMTVEELLGVRAIAYYSNRPGVGTEPIWAQREAWLEDGQVSAPCEGADTVTFLLP